jgi:hypothetical protein
MNTGSSPAPGAATATVPWWERPIGPPTVPNPLTRGTVPPDTVPPDTVPPGVVPPVTVPPGAVPPARAAPAPPTAAAPALLTAAAPAPSPAPPAAAAPAPNLTPPAAAAPAAAPAASPPQRPGAALPPLDIRALLHPAEHSRLMIALSAAAIVFGVAAMAVYAFSGWQEVAVYAGVVAVAGFTIWFGLQVYRSRLLGGAVRVSESTLPELQAVFDEVRARLDYRKHVDVYVKDKVDGGSLMTSYLGTRLIEIEGGLVAELLADGHQAELTFLIGRHIGQLKARHQRLTPIFVAISAIDSVKFLQPFLAPYLRATAKSGDQIAAACCGDIGATAATMNRLLAGKELGPQLVIKGVLDQAAVVRRRWLPRLAQLFMSLPHATNRYLNLLAFFARVAPDEINAWRATLDRDTARRLNAALDSSPNRRPPRRRPSVLSTLLALLVTGGVLAASGWLIFGYLAGARAADTASQELLTHVPAGFAATCVPVSVPADDAAQGVDARVDCQPAALGSGGSVVYLHYPTQSSMQAMYDKVARGVPTGNCSSGPGQNTYALASSSQTAGRFACEDDSGQSVLAWTYDNLDILSVATSGDATLSGLYQWWSQGGMGPG